MKHVSALQFFCFLILPVFSQSYLLTVENGYGGGYYEAGDTVHIWSKETPSTSYFSNWTGDVDSLFSVNEWHTELVMPEQAISVTAQFKEFIAGDTINSEQIMCAETEKTVYYFFPNIDSTKGVIYFFHSSYSDAESWTSVFERFYAVSRFCAEGYAAIILSSEECELITDIDGDDNIGWILSSDSAANIDVQNIIAIRDTFINRGWLLPETPQFAFGTSGGGAFATNVATILNMSAAISHHAEADQWVIPETNTPIRFNMNENDTRMAGGGYSYELAYQNYLDLLNRGICSEYTILRTQPLYPERFARPMADDTSSLSLSIRLFNELKTNGILDDKNYLLVSPDSVETLIDSFAESWPEFNALSNEIYSIVLTQMRICYAMHVYHNDFLAADLNFFENYCSSSLEIQNSEKGSILVYPNPAKNFIYINSNIEFNYSIYDNGGQIILSGISDGIIYLPNLSAGIYYIKTTTEDKFSSASFFVSN